MYDFRHNACCYWLPRYKSELQLMYRFGWKKSNKIYYYSEFLGLRDSITDQDLDIMKNKKAENKIDSEDRLKSLEEQIKILTNMLGQSKLIKEEELA